MDGTYLFDLVFVCRLEDAVACNVVALASNVFTHLAEKVAIRNADICEERDEVVWRVSSVRAAVVETSRRQWFCEELLAAKWRVATSALVRITTNISVAVADVVKVLGLEFLCSIVSGHS